MKALMFGKCLDDFDGGKCLEDFGNLQCSEPIRRMIGVERIPDPTMAGDFLRRFEEENLMA